MLSSMVADGSLTTCIECGQKLPLAQRIKSALAGGSPLTARRIWAALGEQTTTLMSVRQTCRRMRDKGEIKVQKKDGSGEVQGWVVAP